MKHGIPNDVERFVADHIDSVAQLEALLLLRRSPERSWRVEELATRVFVSPSRGERLMEQLCGTGLVVRTGAHDFRYSPTPELTEVIDKLADTYARHLVALTDLIHSVSVRRLNPRLE